MFTLNQHPSSFYCYLFLDWTVIVYWTINLKQLNSICFDHVFARLVYIISTFLENFIIGILSNGWLKSHQSNHSNGTRTKCDFIHIINFQIIPKHKNCCYLKVRWLDRAMFPVFLTRIHYTPRQLKYMNCNYFIS